MFRARGGLTESKGKETVYLKVTYFHRYGFVCDFTVQLILLVLNSANSCSSFVIHRLHVVLYHCNFQLSASTNFCDFTLIRRNSRN